MILETERLILRPWQDEDAADLYEYAKDPQVGPSAGWPVHTSVENSLEIIRSVLSEGETYALVLKETNQAIGSIGLTTPATTHVSNIGPEERELGYWLGVPYWGQGLMPEAVKKLMEYAFMTLNCTALWCGYYDGNSKSKRCQEKCGFRYHHTEEDKPCLPMSNIHTEHFSRISKEEWLRNKDK